MNVIAFTSVAFALANLMSSKVTADGPARLSVLRSNAGLELSWPATVPKADGSVVRPYFELQRTFDLQRWEPIGGVQKERFA